MTTIRRCRICKATEGSQHKMSCSYDKYPSQYPDGPVYEEVASSPLEPRRQDDTAAAMEKALVGDGKPVDERRECVHGGQPIDERRERWEAAMRETPLGYAVGDIRVQDAVTNGMALSDEEKWETAEQANEFAEQNARLRKQVERGLAVLEDDTLTAPEANAKVFDILKTERSTGNGKSEEIARP